MSHFDYKDQIEDWAKLWDKAQAEGPFKDAEDEHKLNQQTADVSFFGLVSHNPSAGASDVDAEYWRQVSAMADHNPTEMMSEMLKAKEVGQEASRMAQSANSIPGYSVGKDQALDAKAIKDPTPEINNLLDLKNKLHDLGSKVAKYSAEGKSTKELDAKISSLNKQIDDISDELSGLSTDLPAGGK